jgi:hypothetical protein
MRIREDLGSDVNLEEAPENAVVYSRLKILKAKIGYKFN